jgi:hypothetical protein
VPERTLDWILICSIPALLAVAVFILIRGHIMLGLIDLAVAGAIVARLRYERVRHAKRESEGKV